MSGLLNLQGQILLLLAAGVLLRRSGILGVEAKSILTDLVIYLILPCNIINSFRIEFSFDILRKFAIIFFIAVFVQIYCFIFAKILYIREGEAQRKVFQYATIVSNSGFMGNPIAESVYGATGLLYASIYLIPQRIIMWSAGISLFTESPDTGTLIRKVLKHPCIVAVAIGMVIMISGIELPAFLGNTIKSVGQCTTSISMILIGTILYDVNIKSMLDIKVVLYTVLRLFIIPGITFLFCRYMNIDSIVSGTCVLLAAMPAGSTTAILAAKYEGDAELATKLVVFSTLATVISVPLWCGVM